MQGGHCKERRHGQVLAPVSPHVRTLQTLAAKIHAACRRHFSKGSVAETAGAMALTVKQRAKRALVSLLLALAGAYGVPLTLTRDSPDTDVKKAWRRVSAKVHPDKGMAA